MTDNVIEIGSKQPIVIDDDMHEDVCEHCAFGKFKDTGPLGECRANPPTAGMMLVPRQNPITGQVEPVMQPWSAFPTVERRMYCFTFEPMEGETQH
jgi:hypothetical protein